MSDMARIEIKLRADGRVDMCSTFLGRHNSTFFAFAPELLHARVDRLIGELWAQMAAETRRQLLVYEAAAEASRG